MAALPWQTIPDFVVLTAALYILLRWANQARAMRIALAVVGLHAAALLARQFDLIITNLVLDGAAVLAVIMLLVVFQPELRRAFLRLDSALRFVPRSSGALESADRAIAEALFSMASVRTGALIVLVRDDSLQDMVDGGVEIGAEISPGLLEAIFQKTSPLHDGAAICERGRLTRANVVLPLTQRVEVPFYFGTRHRAAMGLAERCDAIVLAASEERGEVTLMAGRDIRLMATAVDLTLALRRLRRPEGQPWWAPLRAAALSNFNVKLGALGLAAVIWFLSFVASGTTVRNLVVPVEFLNVPTGMEVADQSRDRVDVELRGRTWILETGRLASIAARFDLQNAKAGAFTLRVAARNLNLPPGIEIDSVSPPAISLRLTPRASISSKPN